MELNKLKQKQAVFPWEISQVAHKYMSGGRQGKKKFYLTDD